MNKLLKSVNLNTIFLIDAIGAFYTGLVLACFYLFLNEHSGFPPDRLRLLSGLALAYGLFSSFAHQAAPRVRLQRLPFIMVANLGYIGTTAYFVATYFNQMHGLLRLHFSLEILLVLFLVNLERRVYIRAKNQLGPAQPTGQSHPSQTQAFNPGKTGNRKEHPDPPATEP